MNTDQNSQPEKGPLILIVDDIPENLQVLASILSNEGYEISAAKSAIRALSIVDKIFPDLILLDVMMPHMDGFELCRKLKENPVTSDIPVIFLTAMAEVEDIVKGFKAGGIDYVTKPFNSTELLARVKTHLELKDSKEKLSHSINQLQQANSDITKKNIKIQEINRHLTDSINYAQLIQQAILPKQQDIVPHFKESFLFFKPRDIVSGDFFWISESDERIIIAVVDCTGHGVPGAFISILGYQLMHEIILLRGLFKPDEILNSIHRKINDVFSHEDANTYGGMDMALCSIDLKNNTLEFAGARNPLVFIHDNELHHFKGNRFSIGGGFKKRKDSLFTSQTISIRESTMFYLFTDGFQDQLGTDERRFSRQQFHQLLQNIHHLPIEQQQEILDSELSNWMGDEYEQIDDILILGFRI